MDTTNSNIPAIAATDVDVASTWSQRVRLRGVNWTVQRGEYWVVGGPHGAGKTDLLMTVAGLNRPAAGSVRIFGREIVNAAEKEFLEQRARIGFVFKGGGRMFTDLTVAENVALAICYHRNCSLEDASAEVASILEMTGLSSRASETAQTLGSDWLPRVGLARALALKPEVLFLDEPGAGLAARHREWWLNFLAQLSAGAPQAGGRKMTLIAATNDFALWSGRGQLYGLIKDKQWQVVGEAAEFPQIE